MKNLLLLGSIFLSTSFNTTVFALTNEVPKTPEIITESLLGSVDGFNVRNGDDKIDFGLVLPTLTKAQVMDFNLSYVLSSETSVIRAVGQRINVPSNLSLPMQSERYSFFTVRIDKPEFKLPITTSEVPREVVVLEGSFPFADTVDTLRSGKPLFAVINSFDFKSYSVSPVEAPNTPLSLAVGESAIEGEAVEFSSPFDEDADFLTIGLNMASTLSEVGQVRHFPIDVKTLERPESLKTDLSSDTTPVVVSIPKDVFESAEDAAAKPFPFTMVWGEASPSLSLPLAKDFITYNSESSQIQVDFGQIQNLDILGLRSAFADADGNEIKTTTYHGNFKKTITVLIPNGAARARVDVFAIDADPIKTSIIVENPFSKDDILLEAKYLSRYEQDIN